MPKKVTVEEAAQMVAQLPPTEKLKLIARICEQLASTPAMAAAGVATGERLAEVDAWLAECDAVAESIEGEFDSAEDIRRIRAERAARL